MVQPYEIIIKPIITEKASKGIMEEKFYTFEVAENANKTNVKWAIETLFVESGAVVEKVNIINVKPKKKTMGRYQGTKKGYKKAIVYLRAGIIPIFGSEQEAEEQKQKKDGIGSKISSMVADSILKDKEK